MGESPIAAGTAWTSVPGAGQVRFFWGREVGHETKKKKKAKKNKTANRRELQGRGSGTPHEATPKCTIVGTSGPKAAQKETETAGKALWKKKNHT